MGPCSFQKVSFGQSCPTYIISSPTARVVLRKRPGVKLPKSAHDIHREFRVLSALYPTGYPVPEPLLYYSDRELLGTDFYIMRFVDGRIFNNPAMPGVSPQERAKLYRSALAELVRLHSYTPGDVGLQDLAPSAGRGYYSRQISRLAKVSSR